MPKSAASLSENARGDISEALAQGLSNTVVATMLAQNFHWNVQGMSFGSLHALFMEIYEDHFVGQDDLAERIRALQKPTEGRLAKHLELADIKEQGHDKPAEEMVRLLMEAEETLSKSMEKIAAVAIEHEDSFTEDLAVERTRVHDKFAWMLRAHINT